VIRTALDRKPLRSATPTAISITSTVPNGGKLMKFWTKFSSHQTIPPVVRMPRTGIVVVSPGIRTDTPDAATIVDTNASVIVR
jgi:hypothetical protein